MNEKMQPCAELADKTLVLVGMMGAGKTTVGRALARRLGRPFMDADREIEKAAGCTVSEIFARFGEKSFRDGERKVIKRLLKGPPCVLATGGGAFMDIPTRKAVARHGLSIWLKADLDCLMERVSRTDKRPLLQAENPRAVMEDLLARREPIYAQSDVTVVVDNRNVEATATAILQALNQHVGAEVCHG